MSEDPAPTSAPIPSDPTARTWAEVSLGAIRRNVARLVERTGGADILAVVKANAYGHGLLPVARAMLEAGAWGLAVASLDEAEALRAAGVSAPIVVLMPILPAEAPRAVALDVTQAVGGEPLAEALSEAARVAGRTLPVHLDVDTGMGRTGAWDRDAAALAKRIAELPGLQVDGILTHFATADESERGFTERQLERFDALLDALAGRGVEPPRIHVANSAAALRFPRAVRALVRPGIVLYGAAGEIADVDPSEFEPALSWHARVVAVKELAPGDSVSYHRRYVARRRERIAILGVGYGDGLPYTFSARGEVLLRGRRVPVRGAVCMDLTMVDATPFPDLRPGEVATIVGRQAGAEQRVEDVARAVESIGYDVLTGITRRVRRTYTEGDPG